MKRFTIVLSTLLALSFVAGAAFAGDGEHVRRHKIVIERHGDHTEIGDGEETIRFTTTPGFFELFGGGGYLGVQMTDLTPELRTHFGVPEDAGVMVSKVVEGSPAERAGLRVGDVITRVDGEDVDSAIALRRLVSGHEDGDEAVLEIWRAGSAETVTAVLEEREGHGMFSHGKMFFDRKHDGAVDMELDCGSGCEVKVECENGDCVCRKNGEEVDCEELHGFHKDLPHEGHGLH